MLNGLEVKIVNDEKPIIIICWNIKVRYLSLTDLCPEFKKYNKIEIVKINNHSNKLPSWFPHDPLILYKRGFVVWELLKTVRLLNSEIMNKIINEKKLIKRKKNWKKNKFLNLTSNFFSELLILKIIFPIITKEVKKENINE